MLMSSYHDQILKFHIKFYIHKMLMQGNYIMHEEIILPDSSSAKNKAFLFSYSW